MSGKRKAEKSEKPVTSSGRVVVDLGAILTQARATGDFSPFVAAIPFARFLGLSVERADETLITRMAFSPHVVGNALIPALHGGAVGSLLESAAVFGLIWESRADPAVIHAPRIINITVEYLRSARTADTYAKAEITRQGRRVATVRAIAWQDDPENPIAAANTHFLLPERDVLPADWSVAYRSVLAIARGNRNPAATSITKIEVTLSDAFVESSGDYDGKPEETRRDPLDRVDAALRKRIVDLLPAMDGLAETYSWGPWRNDEGSFHETISVRLGTREIAFRFEQGGNHPYPPFALASLFELLTGRSAPTAD